MENQIKRKQLQREYLLNLLNRVPKSEIQLQSKCAELLFWFYPEHWKRLVCVNNNDRRANTTNVGIVPGASDTYWLAENGHTIYIEFKFDKNTQSDKQKDWERICLSLGHEYVLCNNEDYFWQIIGFNKPVGAEIVNLLR
jgi:hypothetical protein